MVVITCRWREGKLGRSQRSAKVPLRKACPMCPKPSDTEHPGPIDFYLHLQVTILNGSDVHSLYNVSGEQVRCPHFSLLPSNLQPWTNNVKLPTFSRASECPLTASLDPVY